MSDRQKRVPSTTLVDNGERLIDRSIAFHFESQRHGSVSRAKWDHRLAPRFEVRTQGRRSRVQRQRPRGQ